MSNLTDRLEAWKYEDDANIVEAVRHIKELEAENKLSIIALTRAQEFIDKLQAVVNRLAYEPQASMRHYQVIAQQQAIKEDV